MKTFAFRFIQQSHDVLRHDFHRLCYVIHDSAPRPSHALQILPARIGPRQSDGCFPAARHAEKQEPLCGLGGIPFPPRVSCTYPEVLLSAAPLSDFIKIKYRHFLMDVKADRSEAPRNGTKSEAASLSGIGMSKITKVRKSQNVENRDCQIQTICYNNICPQRRLCANDVRS